MKTSWWIYLGILSVGAIVTLTVDPKALSAGLPFMTGGIIVGMLLFWAGIMEEEK